MSSRELIVVLFTAITTFASPAALGPTQEIAELSSPGANASSTTAAPRVNVAIQAGHWKVNELPAPLSHLRGSTGTSGGGRTEAQLNLDIAQRVARLLRAEGLTVEVLPATVPTGYDADLFISLHADGNSSTRPRGYKVSTRWRSEVAALDALLVQSLEGGYGSVTGLPRDTNITRAMRGYYAYSTYRGEEYRLSSTTPAAILEMGFMTNGTDRALMFNNPELIARGVVEGVDRFYARRAEGLRLQAAAERQAEASQYDRSAVVFSGNVNIREGAGTDTRRIGSAGFGQSFPLQQGANNRPGGTAGGRQGTQVVTGSGWYKIALPGSGGDAYISRDFVVVQQ